MNDLTRCITDMKTLLFIIDMQNDFCSPNGSLYVPGAENDIERIRNLIALKGNEISNIILTQDNHQIMDIAHPYFWKNEKGEHPSPFTSVTSYDVIDGKMIPFSHKPEVIDYLEKLEAQKEYTHTIWPEHCIWGSEGAAIEDRLMKEIMHWARKGRYFKIIGKGTYPFTEHFGAFRANVPIPDVPETLLNNELRETMEKYDLVLIAGEAKSHCVANTIKQMFDFPELIKRSVILEDCMSDVTGFENFGKPIFDRAKELGSKIMTVDQYINSSF